MTSPAADSGAAGATSSLERLRPVRTRLPGGVELHHVQAGAGAPLVFIHGVMGDWRSWAAQWDDFRARYTCLSYSRRYNHPNRNDMPSPDHSALVDAQDLLGLLDALGWDTPILVGSSYGAFTALAFAVAHPGRVRAVVASEPPMLRYADFSDEGRAIRAAFRRDVVEPANARFRAGDDEAAAQIMTGGISGSGSAAATPAGMVRRLQNMRAMRMLAMSSDEFPLLEPAALAALPMPVLLLAGERTEPIHDVTFRNLCAAMPRARSARIAGAGHATGRDAPQAFNRTVLEFLATLDRAAGA